MLLKLSNKGKLALVVAGSLCCCNLWVCSARVVNVGVSNGTDAFAFFPSTTNITVGDSVLWTWFNINHSVSNTSQLFFSKVQNTGATFTNTFNTAGTFAYQCNIHVGFGMTGSIIVSAATPPTLAITNPTSGAVFAVPANVTIRASATNGSGNVTNVQFRVGTTILTNDNLAPFAAITNNLAAGSYTLAAIAQDDAGLTATNSVSISVVTPVSVALTNVAKFSGTNLQFKYLVNTGLSYVVQLSTNLASANWVPLATNVAASNPVVFLDTHATNKTGFYRVGRMPNP
jgi:plastocyanin